MSRSHTISDVEVAAAVQGDAEARNRLLGLLGPQVRAMVAIRLAPRPAQWHTAEDLAQQAMTDLIEAIGRLKQPVAACLRRTASTIVERRVADLLRDAGPQRPAAEASLDATIPMDGSTLRPLITLLASTGVTPQSAAARSESIGRLLAELGKMRPVYRHVITLAFFDQMSTVEISEYLGLSREAGSMLLLRAMRTLRRNLTGDSQLQTIHVKSI